METRAWFTLVVTWTGTCVAACASCGGFETVPETAGGPCIADLVESDCTDQALKLCPLDGPSSNTNSCVDTCDDCGGFNVDGDTCGVNVDEEGCAASGQKLCPFGGPTTNANSCVDSCGTCGGYTFVEACSRRSMPPAARSAERIARGRCVRVVAAACVAAAGCS